MFQWHTPPLHRSPDAAMRCLLACCALALSLLLSGCGLPPPQERTTSQGLEVAETASTPLGKGVDALRRQAGATPDLTGFYALLDAKEAFAARALMARMAQRSLDIQYYIWRGDKTGDLLAHELILAADRGVRVRLLLDDAGTEGLDDTLLALDSHPLIEVRLFNPFTLRWPKPLGYTTDFFRLNRRMHNKSFTADNQATIVGGRNVGNEYFGATDGVLFADLDLLAVGAIVPAVSKDFDRYWASTVSYPVGQIVTRPASLSLQGLRAQGHTLLESAQARDYRDAVAQTPFIQRLVQAQLPMEWVPARLVSDDPAKALGTTQARQLIGTQIRDALGEPEHSLNLVSPYFIPTEEGVQAIAALRDKGVQVRVLTNSAQATDVTVVHAGYAKYRPPLLRHGVELYELRRTAPRYVPDDERQKFALPALGSSGSSLHAKTMAVDGKRVFVGSFNFDPRSAALNTEMGIVVDSPALATQIEQGFATQIPAMAYRVVLDEKEGQLRWHSGVGHPPPVYNTEPDMSLARSLLVWLVAILPVEWLL